MKFKVVIKGLAPMLQHRFSEDKLLSVKKASGDKRLTEEEKKKVASQFLYMDKGKLCQPSAHIEGAMVKAASDVKLSGSSKKSYKDLVKGAVFVFPEFIPHKNQKWVVDERSVVNPTTRGRAMCYRPRLDDWELSFDMEVNDDRADEHAIKQILEIAGTQKGIGAYRPRFGRFEVASFKKVK